jgi:hypothetical protein
MEPHDANGLEPRIRGHDQVSAEAAEEAIGKDQYAPLTQPLSCEAAGGRPPHQSDAKQMIGRTLGRGPIRLARIHDGDCTLSLKWISRTRASHIRAAWER